MNRQIGIILLSFVMLPALLLTDFACGFAAHSGPVSIPAKQWPDPAHIKVQASWSVIDGLKEKEPVIIRVNRGLKELAGHPAFPERIEILIRFNSAGSDGMPSAEENFNLQELEDSLANALTSSNKSLYAAVVTGMGSKRLIFYTSDLGNAAIKANEILKKTDDHHIEVLTSKDFDWGVYRSLSDGKILPNLFLQRAEG